MGDILSAFRVFLAPGFTLTYHRLKYAFFPDAKTPEREPWRRAGCASTSEQYAGMGWDQTRSWRHSALQRARNAAGILLPRAASGQIANAYA